MIGTDWKATQTNGSEDITEGRTAVRKVEEFNQIGNVLCFSK